MINHSLFSHPFDQAWRTFPAIPVSSLTQTAVKGLDICVSPCVCSVLPSLSPLSQKKTGLMQLLCHCSRAVFPSCLSVVCCSLLFISRRLLASSRAHIFDQCPSLSNLYISVGVSAGWPDPRGPSPSSVKTCGFSSSTSRAWSSVSTSRTLSRWMTSNHIGAVLRFSLSFSLSFTFNSMIESLESVPSPPPLPIHPHLSFISASITRVIVRLYRPTNIIRRY